MKGEPAESPPNAPFSGFLTLTSIRGASPTRTTMLAPSDGEQTVFFTDGLDNGCDCFLRTPAGYTAGGAK